MLMSAKFTLAFTVLALPATSAMAAVSLTTGQGSAVSTVDASANFESTGALFDNPYSEGTLEFSRTNLSFNNNSCGFGGCNGHAGFTGFSGNYMYGTGTGFFSIASTGSPFSGLEFVIGTGYSSSTAGISWEAFLNNLSVGSGSTVLPIGTVVGFSGQSFDTLRYTDLGPDFRAPAFDSVRAEFASVGAVPEPTTWAMMLLGFGIVGGALRSGKRRQKLNISYA